MKQEQYKHWNIFFNGKTLEFLLYLEQKGHEPLMIPITSTEYQQIKDHFLEDKEVLEDDK